MPRVGGEERTMDAQDLTGWVRLAVKAIDEFLFDFLPHAYNRYFAELPLSVVFGLLVLGTGVVVYVSLLPTQRGDVANIGIVMVGNAIAKAAKGLAVLAFYGSLVGLFAFAVMRMLP